MQISFMRSCPDHLVYTNGHIEPVTDPMKRAWVFKNREAFLANRVLHSLDDQSVLMSDEDYETVRKLVSAAMVDTGEQASRVIQDYSKALESLEEARRRQLTTSQDSKFALDLSKQPYSMRRQTKPSWPRDDASKEFCSWAWRQVHEEHSRVPGTTVSLSLENSDLDLAPFTTDNGRRLRSRLQESAKLYWNAREIEDECFNPSAMPLKYVHLQSHVRFHCVEKGMYTVADNPHSGIQGGRRFCSFPTDRSPPYASLAQRCAAD